MYAYVSMMMMTVGGDEIMPLILVESRKEKRNTYKRPSSTEHMNE